MKKKLTSKLMLKIVSVIVAFLFWLVIINITDPTTSKTFYDIPVQILNENVITSANQVYDIVAALTLCAMRRACSAPSMLQGLNMLTLARAG